MAVWERQRMPQETEFPPAQAAFQNSTEQSLLKTGMEVKRSKEFLTYQTSL